jgi:lipopolysaccharide export system permease protein
MLNRFDRYIAGLIFLPLFSTLIISAMLLLLENMLRLFTFVMNEGGPVSVVWRMLGNLIPQYLGLGIPIGLFLGILLAFRKLALSSELDAMLSAGVSYWRLLRVPFLYAAAMSMITLAIVGFIQPYSRYAYEGLKFELRTGALGASVKVGEFARFGKRMTLRVEESRNQGADLRGIFAHVRDKDGSTLAISAARGTFLSTDDPDTIVFRLYDGVLVHTEEQRATPRVLTFSVHDLPVDLPAIQAFRARGGEQLEMTLPELWQARDRADIAPQLQRYSDANFHRRVIQAIIPFALPFLALAMAVPPKRTTSALGVFVGIILLVVLNEVLEALERAAGLAGSVPGVVQWLPAMAFFILAYWLFYVLAHKVGGQPLGMLHFGIQKIAKRLGRLLRPFQRRRRLAPQG